MVKIGGLQSAGAPMTGAEVQVRAVSHAARADRSPMHLQPQSWESQRGPGVSVQLQDLTPDEIGLLRLVCEHMTLPVDLLARYEDCTVEEMTSRMQRLEAALCVASEVALPDKYRWYWLTARGITAADIGFQYKVPGMNTFPLRRWIFEVRLEMMRHRSDARWFTDRILTRGIHGHPPVPKAVLDTTGDFTPELFHEARAREDLRPLNVTAVYVLTSLQHHSVFRRRLDRDCALFAAVAYFCSPETMGLMQSLQATNRWPNFSLHPIPGYPDDESLDSVGVEYSLDSSMLPLVNQIAQHGAMPTDLLARALDRPHAEVLTEVSALEASRHVNVARVHQDPSEWVWLTRSGVRCARPRLPWIRRLGATRVAFNRRVLECWLYALQQVPDGRWESRRELEVVARRQGHPSVPNGVFHVDGERHAILVRVSPSKSSYLEKLVMRHLPEHHAVVLFCTSNNRYCLERLKKKHGWENVGILSLPPSSIASVEDEFDEDD